MNELLNKITLGDCFEVIKKIPDKSIDAVITDPPYLLTDVTKESLTQNFKYLEENKPNTEAYRIAKQGLKMKEANIVDGFDIQVFIDECVRISKCINFAICCNVRQIHLYCNAIEKHCNIRDISFDLLKWIKSNPNPITHNNFKKDCEYCVLFREKKQIGGFNFKNVENAYTYDTISVSGEYSDIHPTSKPIKWIQRQIGLLTNENDLVLDCFSGSGTTAIACKNSKRNFIAIEKSEQFYKDSLIRFNKESQDVLL